MTAFPSFVLSQPSSSSSTQTLPVDLRSFICSYDDDIAPYVKRCDSLPCLHIHEVTTTKAPVVAGMHSRESDENEDEPKEALFTMEEFNTKQTKCCEHHSKQEWQQPEHRNEIAVHKRKAGSSSDISRSSVERQQAPLDATNEQSSQPLNRSGANTQSGSVPPSRRLADATPHESQTPLYHTWLKDANPTCTDFHHASTKKRISSSHPLNNLSSVPLFLNSSFHKSSTDLFDDCSSISSRSRAASLHAVAPFASNITRDNSPSPRRRPTFSARIANAFRSVVGRRSTPDANSFIQISKSSTYSSYEKKSIRSRGRGRRTGSPGTAPRSPLLESTTNPPTEYDGSIYKSSVIEAPATSHTNTASNDLYECSASGATDCCEDFPPPRPRERRNRSLSVGGELECREFYVRQIERYGLPAVMNSPVALSYFLAFLISEYNPECLLFVRAVEAFRLTTQTAFNKQQKQATPPSASPLTTQTDEWGECELDEYTHKQAHILWKGFISRSAPLEVNIRADTRNAVRRTLENKTSNPSMFSEAANHVMDLVQSGFLRFRQSASFEEMVADMRKYTGSKSSEEYGRRRAAALVMDAMVKTYSVRKRHGQLVLMLKQAATETHCSTPTLTPAMVSNNGLAPVQPMSLSTPATPMVPSSTAKINSPSSTHARLFTQAPAMDMHAQDAEMSPIDLSSSRLTSTAPVEAALNRALTASSTSFALVAWVYQFSQRELGFPLPSYQEAMHIINHPYKEQTPKQNYTHSTKTTQSIPSTPRMASLPNGSLKKTTTTAASSPLKRNSQKVLPLQVLAVDPSTFPMPPIEKRHTQATSDYELSTSSYPTPFKSDETQSTCVPRTKLSYQSIKLTESSRHSRNKSVQQQRHSLTPGHGWTTKLHTKLLSIRKAT
ncbi:hypothetical protein H4219_001327 [Mycoemilia scoparia]|uniref:RGS domain-containing protein n=1 Tax=Mycoemilia scoparia TaxID=417184 RepID=A0A9W8A0C2_9FUNG|nr:hypothetical protein H4219_001327 [Mycoemilia scoparia]